ncbi:hypothetical protein AJ78_01698 [Emergomyces pasteurianus Ep9510]|uniref:Uncharacterized protein n=1 Tax=Emergomyces pasteurianus Ep9510 TaxID=1447872 RepID=A0A1J9QDH6_9EURO|nr:hypothetical protein AJ78_01698 [Emergomyces pasteurianus Ep9510]
MSNHIFAQRLSLIYSVHEIDYKPRAVKYAYGTKLKTRAYQNVAKKGGGSLENVKACERKGKSYTKLMQEVGSAIIFKLNKNVSSLCENSLRNE